MVAFVYGSIWEEDEKKSLVGGYHKGWYRGWRKKLATGVGIWGQVRRGLRAWWELSEAKCPGGEKEERKKRGREMVVMSCGLRIFYIGGSTATAHGRGAAAKVGIHEKALDRQHCMPLSFGYTFPSLVKSGLTRPMDQPQVLMAPAPPSVQSCLLVTGSCPSTSQWTPLSVFFFFFFASCQ
jgi:hypothetical protein